MILSETFQLNNGIAIPKIAFGTWQIENDSVTGAVKAALSVGYRHIDTAAAYENECGVGKALRESGLRREDVFITTKIPADVKTYEGAKSVIAASLKNLGTPYIDLMLIHAPKPWEELFGGSEKTYYEENLAVWKAMEEAVAAGQIRSIGVSNFEVSDLQNLIDHAEIKPAVNQIRIHIGHTPAEVISYCKTNDIVVMAFSPNATGKLLGHPVVTEIAEKYQVSVPQLSIRYDYQLGLIPLPRSTNPIHIAENKNIDFVISDADMKLLSQVEEIQSLDF